MWVFVGDGESITISVQFNYLKAGIGYDWAGHSKAKSMLMGISRVCNLSWTLIFGLTLPKGSRLENRLKKG